MALEVRDELTSRSQGSDTALRARTSNEHHSRMRQPALAYQPWNAVRLAATAYALVVVRANPAELQGEAPRSRAARERRA